MAAVDSLQRFAVSEGLSAVLGSLPATLSRSAISALGPWRPLLLPLPTPFELLSRWGNHVLEMTFFLPNFSCFQLFSCVI